MRRFGYATLAVETAGYSGGNQQSTQGVAVPLAPREEVYELARDIEPFGDLDFDRPPKRARRRYLARFSLAAAGLTASPTPSTRWCLRRATGGSPPSSFSRSASGTLPLATPRVRPRWLGLGDPERVLAADDAHCAVLPAPDGVRHAVAVPAPP